MKVQQRVCVFVSHYRSLEETFGHISSGLFVLLNVSSARHVTQQMS